MLNDIRVNQMRQENMERIFGALALFAVVAMLFYAIIYWFLLQNYALTLNNIVASAICLVIYVFYKKTNHYQICAHTLSITTFLALFFLNFVMGGDSSPALYWLLAHTAGTGFLLGVRSMLVWTVIVILSIFILGFLVSIPSLSLMIHKITPIQTMIIHYSTFVGVILLFCIFAYAYIRSLNKMVDNLEDYNQEIRTILRIVEHDIASPLIVTQQQAKILTNIIQKKQWDKIEDKHTDRLNRSVQQIVSILKSVQELDHLTKGNIFPEKSIASVDQSLQQALSILKTKLDYKNIQYKQIGEDLEIQTDPDLFVNQILVNILTNAIKFSSKDSTIEVTIDKVDNKCALIIQDHGIGMPPQIIENLFNAYAETSRKGTMGEPGTGFGMPIVKSCADKLDIGITIESHDTGIETGTIITLFIPLK
jgi:signal transduction histidine kinase